MTGRKLLRQFLDVEAAAESSEVRVPKVSNWTVGQQIDHICLATEKVITSLEAHPSDKPNNKFSLLRLLVLGGGRIPRGRAQAPDAVVPTETPSKEHIAATLVLAKDCLLRLEKIPDTAWFKHVYFGSLSKKQAMRFLYIHTRHHLKIIRDILAAANN